MQDSFHRSLIGIVKILKSVPGSIIVQNIQRLSNVYKFETFIENIDDQIKRLSIAGKILVIDIDFIELKNSNKDQTKFELKDVRLILANNNNNFKYENTITGENILSNALKNYKDLKKFDEDLETLSIFDQFSQDEFDLFDYYVKIYEILKEKFKSLGQDIKVSMNLNDEFEILIDDKYVISIINDDRLNLLKNEVNGTTDTQSQGGQRINDVGIQVRLINCERGFIPITKNIILENDIILESYSNGVIFDNGEVYKSTHNNFTIEGFQFFQSEVINIDKFFSNDLESCFNVILNLIKFDKVYEAIVQLKKKFQLMGKFDKLEQEDIRLNDFISDNVNGNGDGDDMEVESRCVTISLKKSQIEVKSNFDESYNFSIDWLDMDKLEEGLKKLKRLIS